jgi:hypothetical protein
MAVLELTGEKVNVYPFSENLPAVQEVPIATVLSADNRGCLLSTRLFILVTD